MNRIEVPMSTPTDTQSKIEQIVDREQGLRKWMVKSVVGYGGIAISMFLMFVTVMVVTTEMTISLESLAKLGTDFFLLLFCSYASYICCADSGYKAGKSSSLYITTLNKFDTLQQSLIDRKIHCILGEFCKQYIATELRNARTYYLVMAGVEYDEYVKKYLPLEITQIERLPGFSVAQKRALISANAVKPIRLYPEQIISHGGAHSRRSPLQISPDERRRKNYIAKFISIVAISLGMSLIVLNDIQGSSWTIFVMICVKLGSVIYNCFSGYKNGYENIVIHSVAFMKEQISFMQQAIVFYEDRNEDNENVESKYICVDKIGAGSSDCAGELHG